MNFKLIRPSTLIIGLLATTGAFAQTAERKAFAMPHVLEVKGSGVCAPRDAASGQASGRSSDFHLQIDDKKRQASPQACDSTGAAAPNPQPVRESPTLANGTHIKNGHVTVLK